MEKTFIPLLQQDAKCKEKPVHSAVSDGQDIRDGFSRLILDSRAQNEFQFLCYVPTTRIQHEMTFLPPVQGCGVSQFTTIERVGTD